MDSINMSNLYKFWGANGVSYILPEELKVLTSRL